MVKYCPSCGSEVDPNSIYCFNCGYKIPVTAYPKSKPAWEPPTQPQTTYQPPRYRAAFQPRIYHPSMKAPLTDRCVALLLDNCIDQFFCGIYGCFKDGIRDGQSLGKGVMNLRVIDYNHGIPATIGQSFIRNCLCSWLDICSCYFFAWASEDGRRIGDHIAGTIVIRDN